MIFDVFKNWFSKKAKVTKEIQLSKDGEQCTDAEIEYIKKGKCANCQEGQLYAGPSGGLSQNVRCITCGQGYNITISMGRLIACDNIGIDTQYIDRSKINVDERFAIKDPVKMTELELERLDISTNFAKVISTFAEYMEVRNVVYDENRICSAEFVVPYRDGEKRIIKINVSDREVHVSDGPRNRMSGSTDRVEHYQKILNTFAT